MLTKLWQAYSPKSLRHIYMLHHELVMFLMDQTALLQTLDLISKTKTGNEKLLLSGCHNPPPSPHKWYMQAIWSILKLNNKDITLICKHKVKNQSRESCTKWLTLYYIS